MAARQPTHVAHTIAELRAIAEQAEPGAHLLVEVDYAMPVDDLLQVWEAITDVEGPIELFNLETVFGKKQGADFVEGKIHGLEVLRDECFGRIGCLNNWVQLMERSLKQHVGPAIPANHATVLMVGHPTCFLDLEQIGTANADDKEEILGQSIDVPFQPVLQNQSFWGVPKVRERARTDKRSLIKFNIFYLKIKIEVLKAMCDKLTKGIKGLRGQFEGRVYLGCSKEGFASFRDLLLLGPGGGLDLQ